MSMDDSTRSDGLPTKPPAKPVRVVAGAASLLAGPRDGAGGVHVTPRLPTPGGPDEIKIRLLRRATGLVVHVTAPSPEMADAIVKQFFGDNQPYIIELCG